MNGRADDSSSAMSSKGDGSMGRRPLRLAGALLAGALLLGACGGDKGNDGDNGNTGGGTRDCSGEALSSEAIKLPADFPIPGEAVLTTSSEAGPSQIVEGYWDGDLQSAYDEWKNALDGAGYAILFDEIEDTDSEISYTSADEASTGQIALRSECMQADRTFVHITNRPA